MDGWTRVEAPADATAARAQPGGGAAPDGNARLRRRNPILVGVLCALTLGAYFIWWTDRTLRATTAATGARRHPDLWSGSLALLYLASFALFGYVLWLAFQPDASLAKALALIAGAGALLLLAALGALALDTATLVMVGRDLERLLSRQGLRPLVPPLLHLATLATGVWPAVGAALLQADINRHLGRAQPKR